MLFAHWSWVFILSASLVAGTARAAQTDSAEALAETMLETLCDRARSTAARDCYDDIELMVSLAAKDAMKPPTGGPELALVKAAERGLAAATSDGLERSDWARRLLLAKLARVRVLIRLARPIEAEEAMRALIGQAANELGNDPLYQTFLLDYGEVLQGVGREAEAESVFRQVLKLRERAYGRESLEASVAQSFLGVSRYRQGDHVGAETLLRAALLTRERLEGETIESASLMSHLALSLKKQDRQVEAIPLLRQGITILERLLPDDNWRTGIMQANLADAMVRTGQVLASEPLLISAQRAAQKRLEPEHPFRLRIEALLAVVSIRRGSAVEESHARLAEVARRARQRIARYAEMNAAARSELETLRGVFIAQAQANWVLARR